MTPQEYPQNLHTPQNIHFSENPKNNEIQNFESPKMTRAYVCMKISEYPPPGLHTRSVCPVTLLLATPKCSLF